MRLGEGDILVFRTGHHRRRLELGRLGQRATAGEGKAGLHVDTIPWMHERRIAAFLPDGDGDWAYTWLQPGRDTDELADRFFGLLVDGMRGYSTPA